MPADPPMPHRRQPQVAGAGDRPETGPLLTWSAPDCAFVLRIGNYREPFAWPKRGVVFDLANMKTGWCSTAGRAREWKWNRDKDHFEPRPSSMHKKGFSIPCSIGGGPTATWQQSGAASWGSVSALNSWVAAGAELAAGKLPLVKLTGQSVETYKRGRTTTPILRVDQWVRRPACLGGEEPFEAVIANAEDTAETRRAEREARAYINAERQLDCVR